MITFWKLYIKIGAPFEILSEIKKGTAWFPVKGVLNSSKTANIYSGYFTLWKISMKTNKIVLTFYPYIPNFPRQNLRQYKKIPTLNSTFLSWYLKWVLTMCLYNTLDAHFSYCSKTHNREKYKKIVRKFRHDLYIFILRAL